MITLLVNIETEIANALRKTNGSVGWRVIAEIVAGGLGRVQPVNRTTIAKFVMTTDVFGRIYCSVESEGGQVIVS